MQKQQYRCCIFVLVCWLEIPIGIKKWRQISQDDIRHSQGLCHWLYGKIHIWRKAPTYLACNYSKYSFFAMNMCNWKFHLQNELGLERFQGNFLSTCFWSIFQKNFFAFTFLTEQAPIGSKPEGPLFCCKKEKSGISA